MVRDTLRKLGYHKEVALMEQGICPVCGEAINMAEFRDEVSRRECSISGLCQNCQDNC